MARNTLSDLNDHLFAQIERLGEEDLKDEKLKEEIERARAINGVAKNIIMNAKTALDGVKFSAENMRGKEGVPVQFKLKEEN